MDAPVLVERSCVVVAHAHNPSILNHDWLIRNQVLPGPDWEWAEPPFTTLPMTRICYQNNIELLLDSERLTVRAGQLALSADPADRIIDIAVNYVNILPHIPYVAIGNNFQALVEYPDSRGQLVDRFGGSGGWAKGLEDVSVGLVHKMNGCTRTVQLAAGTAPKTEDAVATVADVILMSGNYHRGTQSKDETVEALQRGGADLDDFLAFVSELAEDIHG